MDKIVVSMVNGAAYAGGAVLAACSDIAIASERAVFCIPEALVGIADQLSTTWLEASIGLARTKLLILTAQEITAAEAQAIGLIAAVAPHDALRTRTRQIVDRVLRTAPGARAAYKHLLNDRLPKVEQRHIVASHLSEESREGADAFRQKRLARWVPVPT
jgi:enoyl-CoA hydratase/carnithine racemase